MDYQSLLASLEARLKKIYPDATITQTIDDSGNSIWKTVIPGYKIIESQNVNAISVFVENLEGRERAKAQGVQIVG